ncbi:MAG: helix-turn-helix transcriptional regulator [Clostridiales bacterium]|nr:helix-turn-helix transcriptional regulator [Clostridiales bacterium]
MYKDTLYAEKIRKARIKKGFTIEELSRISGVSVQNIINLENGVYDSFSLIDAARLDVYIEWQKKKNVFRFDHTPQKY